MPTHEARELSLACLMAPATAPPRNRLSKRPDITRALKLYNLSLHMGALPYPGGLLDQPADLYAYFSVFAATEAEYNATKAGS